MKVYYFDNLAAVMHKLYKFIQFYNNKKIHKHLYYFNHAFSSICISTKLALALYCALL